MQPIGIFLLSMGIWQIYCGAKGISALKTAQAIIANPNNSRQIINNAETAANAPYKDILNQALTAKDATHKVAAQVVGGPIGLNPYAIFPVTCDFACHRKRGSAGGTDYGMPVGTPVISAFSGTVTHIPNAGAAGNEVKLALSNGYTIVFMHLSKFAGKSGDKVSPGTILGLSGGKAGAPGAGSSTGPHLHVNVITPSGAVADYTEYVKGVRA